jgi:hypothetical protein
MGELPSRVYVVREGAIELTRELHSRLVTSQLRLMGGEVTWRRPVLERSGRQRAASIAVESPSLGPQLG